MLLALPDLDQEEGILRGFRQNKPIGCPFPLPSRQIAVLFAKVRLQQNCPSTLVLTFTKENSRILPINYLALLAKIQIASLVGKFCLVQSQVTLL